MQQQQTIALLKECSSGCKMALKSIRQVEEYAREEPLKNVLDKYDQKHHSLERETDRLLQSCGKTGEEPGMMATAFAWMDTQVKMLMEADAHQIAKLMMDGCNMGIQKISEYINQYKEASPESLAVARKLVKAEEGFMEEMRAFL